MSGTLRPGQPWGTETTDPPDVEVTGSDAALASVVAGDVTDPLVRFVPRDSDLAIAVGLVAGAPAAGLALPLDVFALAVEEKEGGTVPSPGAASPGAARRCAVNSVVIGVAPDRLRAWHRPAGLSVEIDGARVIADQATTLVVMNGQYLRRLDVAPRGHPGDGVAEAQLYALAPSARRAMRTRLPTGAHLPHPAITTRKARRVVVHARRPVPLELDGVAAGRITALELELRPAAYRLLV